MNKLLSYDAWMESWGQAVSYVKSEMQTVLDDDYPDKLEEIAIELEEVWEYTDSEIENIIEEAGY